MTSSTTNAKSKTARTIARRCGYILFVVGLFFTIAAVITLPLFFAFMFGLIIVGAIFLIRWGNTKK